MHPSSDIASRRCVVTFEDPHARIAEAAALLRIPARDVIDAQQALRMTLQPERRVAMWFEGLGAIAIDLSERETFELRIRDEVVEVIDDTEVRALAATPSGRTGRGSDLSAAMDVSAATLDQPELPCNMELVRAPHVWESATGAGIRVALLDSGIDETHPDLYVAGGISFVRGVASWNDDSGHGTHCAGIVGARNVSNRSVGVAPGCDLYAVKVLAGHASGALSSILAGMLWCAQNRMHVISMHVGSPAGENPDGLVVYQRAAERCMADGAIVLAAAGNSGDRDAPWVREPARCADIMAVGAVDRSGALAGFSAHGPDSLGEDRDVEITAPGVAVRSTVPGGGYWNMSGTSMACAHVAGAAALLRQLRPAWTPAQVRECLRATTASGLLDCDRATRS
jgi:subtilisin family serine protease